jgi:hypothetical protein
MLFLEPTRLLFLEPTRLLFLEPTRLSPLFMPLSWKPIPSRVRYNCTTVDRNTRLYRDVAGDNSTVQIRY